MTVNYPVDLHSHSNLSDGADSIQELVLNAVKSGLKVLALTDHDILPPQEVRLAGGGTYPLIEWAKRKGLCLIKGVEFSCESLIEDVHIIGMGCDWEREILQKETQAIAKNKADAYVELINRLNQNGYQMTVDEVRSFGDGKTDLMSLQKKQIFDLMAAKGYVPSWSDAKLLVRKTPVLHIKRKKPAAKKMIETIHNAGGIAILAHPYLIGHRVEIEGISISRWEYIETLIQAGLDGIEVRYPYHKTTCEDRRPTAEFWDDVSRFAGGRLIISGGSDYHADYKKGTANPRWMGECGLTMEEFLSVPVFEKFYCNSIREK